MKVEKSRCPITIVTGERLDITEWPLLNNEIKDLVHECGVQLVVDMAKTRFIDSTGLGKLISLLRNRDEESRRHKNSRAESQYS